MPPLPLNRSELASVLLQPLIITTRLGQVFGRDRIGRGRDSIQRQNLRRWSRTIERIYFCCQSNPLCGRVVSPFFSFGFIRPTEKADRVNCIPLSRCYGRTILLMNVDSLHYNKKGVGSVGIVAARLTFEAQIPEMERIIGTR